MVDIYDKDRPSAAIVDWNLLFDRFPHGENGHSGFRCGQCASRGSLITDHGIDHWQNKQLEWQEACDVIMAAFDVAVAEHFPYHIPAVASGPNMGTPRCDDCPEKPVLPEKPVQPFERRWVDQKF